MWLCMFSQHNPRQVANGVHDALSAEEKLNNSVFDLRRNKVDIKENISILSLELLFVLHPNQLGNQAGYLLLPDHIAQHSHP